MGQRSGFLGINSLEPPRLDIAMFQSKGRNGRPGLSRFLIGSRRERLGCLDNRRLNSFAESIIVNVGDCS
jgi:hypothetical protein